MKQRGSLIWGVAEQKMEENAEAQWFKVRLKTLLDLRIAWPLAWFWENPDNRSLPPADEVVIPYLGKTVWVRENRNGSSEIFYEIKDSGGLVVLSEWIEHFLPDDAVPPSGWQDAKKDETWVDLFVDRFLVLDDLVIIHG